MAIAERRLAAEFNRPGHDIVDHRTYVICRDGDLQEGVASEAGSLAGHLRLGKLVVLYDDNRIQLDGPTAWAFSEDVLARFDAYGWHTQRVEDGNDVAAIAAAIDAAKADDRPSIIAVRTHIGYGSPNKQDTQKAHGAPLGPDEVRLTKEAYGWDPDRTFYVPDEAREAFRRAIDAGEDLVAEWESRLDRLRGGAPRPRPPSSGAGSTAGCPTAGTQTCRRTRSAARSPRATRARTRSRRSPASLPELFGGSADLSESNLTDVKAKATTTSRPTMPAATCGSACASTGWARSRTASPTTAASSRTARRSSPSATTCAGRCGSPPCPACTSTYVWTHDSVGLGEDGPTHQPVEHYAALARDPEPVVRATGRRERGGRGVGAGGRAPSIDGAAPGPVALAFTRQKLPTLAGSPEHAREGAAARRLRALREASGGLARS